MSKKARSESESRFIIATLTLTPPLSSFPSYRFPPPAHPLCSSLSSSLWAVMLILLDSPGATPSRPEMTRRSACTRPYPTRIGERQALSSTISHGIPTTCESGRKLCAYEPEGIGDDTGVKEVPVAASRPCDSLYVWVERSSRLRLILSLLNSRELCVLRGINTGNML